MKGNIFIQHNIYKQLQLYNINRLSKLDKILKYSQLSIWLKNINFDLKYIPYKSLQLAKEDIFKYVNIS